MTECNQSSFEFASHFSRQVTAGFDGGTITSDGGALLLRETDRRIHLLERRAACFTDQRCAERTEHAVSEMVSQRVYGLALGYEDVNDHDPLRRDPLLALLAGKAEVTGQHRRCRQDRGKAWAGKSTLNRLEQAVPQPDRYHKIQYSAAAIDELLMAIFREAHREAPAQIVLDLDANDVPLHGQGAAHATSPGWLCGPGKPQVRLAPAPGSAGCEISGHDARLAFPVPVQPGARIGTYGMSPDFLVIGAGVAGLRAAIELSEAGRVLVVAKDTLKESSSEYAQGGIAVALGEDDNIELHEQDTLVAGDGLCDLDAVRTLVEEGPGAIRQLIEWGAEFDREAGELALTREAAHSRNRILHAHGDSTGQEIARTLYRKAASLPQVEFRSFAATTDLLVEDGAAAGAVVYDDRTGQSFAVRARAVLLATGGLGRVFSDTTNPDVATGDGVAMAYRSGAAISDIEFVQFHPTALYLEGAPRFLLSEALRGEGARLRNAAGETFMHRYHPLEELAPRDVVSRSMIEEMTRTGTDRILLDLTHRGRTFIQGRFPRIYQTCLRYGLDLAAEPAPVHPAAHYAMGGVRTDLDGRTSLERLYAAGEAAWTGVHGANRLASNSLLEGVVFGARAGAHMRRWSGEALLTGGVAPAMEFPCVDEERLRGIASRDCAIVRSGEGLGRACRELEGVPFERLARPTLNQHETRSVHTVALLIARCALAREESRGAHFRSDYPMKMPAFARHSLVKKNYEPSFA